MLGPEGNRGIAVCCCFEGYFADTVGGEAALDFGEEHGAYVVAAELRQDVYSDDVAAFVATGADAEADDLFFGRGRVGGCGYCLGWCFRDQAIRAAEMQVSAQLAFRIRDFGFVARLINFVQRIEIFGLENSESDIHSAV